MQSLSLRHVFDERGCTLISGCARSLARVVSPRRAVSEPVFPAIHGNLLCTLLYPVDVVGDEQYVVGSLVFPLYFGHFQSPLQKKSLIDPLGVLCGVP